MLNIYVDVRYLLASGSFILTFEIGKHSLSNRLYPPAQPNGREAGRHFIILPERVSWYLLHRVRTRLIFSLSNSTETYKPAVNGGHQYTQLNPYTSSFQIRTSVTHGLPFFGLMLFPRSMAGGSSHPMAALIVCGDKLNSPLSKVEI